MILALAQINTTVGDMAGNVAKMLECIARAQKNGAQLTAFPELSICGYPPRDLVLTKGFVEQNWEAVQQLSRNIPNGITVVTGYVARSENRRGKPLANAAVVLRHKKILYKQNKILLPTYDVFDESRHFEPGKPPRPFGVNGTRVGMSICEDCWNDKHFWSRQLYQRDPIQELLPEEPGLILNISASPYWIDKRKLRRKMFAALARRSHLPVAVVNAVGGNDSLIFDGSSFVLGPDGKLLAQAPSFVEDLLLVDLEAPAKRVPRQSSDEIEAIFQALVLGTRDYCRKCGFHKAVVGLSGGIDSALTAVIAVHALGKENVIGVGMPGPFSSPGSLSDARQLAQNLGIRFEVAPIGQSFEQFRTTLSPIFGNLPADVTEENLQARARGTILMAISNKLGALVLTTGNKSEVAVGYCTLYGDMVGGLAVIADIYKTKVYELCRWINRAGNVIPPDSLTKAPSAELRANQTDQDSLPPYEVLDQILYDYIERNLDAETIAGRRNFELKMVEEIIAKVNRNEYKRQQAAPSLKVTGKAFGVGRVFPIAQRYNPLPRRKSAATAR